MAVDDTVPLVSKVEVMPEDGTKAAKKRKRNRQTIFSVGLVLYLVFGTIGFDRLEGWVAYESVVFVLSVLTGVGYGHVVPKTAGGMYLAALFILVGLVLFSTLVGEVIGHLMDFEVDGLMAAVKQNMAGQSKAARQTYRDTVQARKTRHCIVGFINLVLVCIISVCIMRIYFSMDMPTAVYYAAITVLRLDSICLLEGIECAHTDGKRDNYGQLIFVIMWYLVTWGIIGHFLVSAANFFGADAEATVSRIDVLNEERFNRMDADGDGKITRSEFLRDRLVRDGIASSEQVEAILRNFDRLDKDKSGAILRSEAQLGA